MSFKGHFQPKPFYDNILQGDYLLFFFFLLLSQVQETNPTTGSLEIISITEDEPPVPEIQFSFKRFFCIPQAKVDPTADGSGRDTAQLFDLCNLSG